MRKKTYKSKTIGGHTLKPESLMMSYGYDPALSEGSVKPPVFLTSTFAFTSAEEGEDFFNITSGRKEPPAGHTGGLIYSRFNHPNVEIIEDRLALLEQSESAVVCSSGMGAISAVLLSALKPGDIILHSTPLYGGTETLIRGFFAGWGIQTKSFADGLSETAMREAARKAAQKGRVAVVLIESPANPTNALIDFQAFNRVIDTLAQDTGHRPLTLCDNTLLGPVFSQVIPAGIDLSVYSLTKYVGGHSDLVAGAVCGSRAHLKPIRSARSALGLNLDPHTSWMISRSLETLTIRMERSSATGTAVARWIQGNPYTPAKVYHPEFLTDTAYQTVYKRQCSGPGSTFSFEIHAPKAQVFALINALSLFKLAVSLGGSESLVCHPASTTHSGIPKDLRDKVGVTDGLVRLSIGLEHPDDLIADLDNAFQSVFGQQQAKAS